MTDSSSSFFSSAHDPPTQVRSSYLLWGLLSLALGLFSLLSMLGQMWWVCGGLGFLGSTLIMIHFSRHHPSLIARLTGSTGLCLSLLIIAYAPTQFYLQQKAICRQSALLGNDWIENILKGKPYKALIPLQNPETRLAEDQIRTFYFKTSEGQKEYKQFIEHKLIKSLIALNGRARSQFYRTESVRSEGDKKIITTLFAVSYLETPLKRKTFFVRLVFKYTFGKEQEGQWMLLRYRGGVRPLKSA